LPLNIQNPQPSPPPTSSHAAGASSRQRLFTRPAMPSPRQMSRRH